MKNKIILLVLLIQATMFLKINAQNIAINSSGSLPDTSAMLDISSTTKGFLAPRMTTIEQSAIPLPATGLLVFNSTLNAFTVNTGTPLLPVWTSLIAGSGSTTNTLGNAINTITSTVNGIAAAAPVINTVSNTSTTNTLTTTVNGITSAGVAIINNNTLSFTGGNLNSDVNGIASTPLLLPFVNSLNSLTATAQIFATGTAGTNFSINSSGTTHTFNLPTASASNRGLLSSVDWNVFNTKQSSISGTGYAKFSGAVPSYISSIPNTDLANSAISIQGISTALGSSVNIINGTGFVTATGTSISYDNNVYLTASGGSSTYEPIIISPNTIKKYLNGYKKFVSFSSDSVTEGSINLYYTNARVQAAITGTANRITVVAGAVNISAAYVGQASITTLGTIGAGTWNAAAIGATKGGTGQTAVTTGDMLYGSAANTWSRLAAGVNGQVLTMAAGMPLWITAGATNWSLTGNPVTAGSQFLGSINNVSLRFKTNNIARAVLDSTGKFGIGVAAPTAVLHLKAGTAAVQTAPVKFNPGVNLTIVENGAVEYDGINYFASAGGVRYTLAKSLSALAILDFASTATNTSKDLTIAVANAALSDVVVIGVPNSAVSINSNYTAFVSAVNTVTVRFNNYSNAAINPPAGTFRVAIIKY